MNLFDEIETPDPKPWGGYDFKKKSLAVIAMGGYGGALLWTVGAHVQMEMDEFDCVTLEDLGLEYYEGERAKIGIWIWEGVYTYVGSDEDCDRDSDGVFRKPTNEEWAAIREGRCPWNDEDWKLPTKKENP